MKKHDIVDRIQIYIMRFLRITLAIAIGFSLYEQRWTIAFVSTFILILTFLVYFIEKKSKILFPIELEFIVVLFIYASLFLGEINNYYRSFWWWDVLLHTSSGLALGLIGFLIMYLLYFKKKIDMSPLLIAVFAFCFGVALGAIWEIFEFSMDQLIGTTMQKSGLVDTMWDLIVDSLGALVITIIGYFYVKDNRAFLINRIVQKFVCNNPKLFDKKDSNKYC